MEDNNYMINGISLQNIRNRFEVIVIKLMEKNFPQFAEFDNCPICTEDVYALSLSRIPSVYVKDVSQVFDDDELMTENVEEIVKYAIFQVMSNPKHKHKKGKSKET
ncbi:late competence development ComFB family protein [bacterium]|nr:late competence development ComFB family protein [bacterium]